VGNQTAETSGRSPTLSHTNTSLVIVILPCLKKKKSTEPLGTEDATGMTLEHVPALAAQL
jgi:hypothetical protein